MFELCRYITIHINIKKTNRSYLNVHKLIKYMYYTTNILHFSCKLATSIKLI